MRGLTLLTLAFGSGESTVQKVAEWSIENVATVHLAKDLPGMPGKSLIGTTFGPTGDDVVYAVGPLSDPSTANVTSLSAGDFSWPNEVLQLPADVKAKASLPEKEYLVVADGFIFPGKQTGGIHLLEVKEDLTTAKTTISTDKHAWFYHHAEWLDVDEDGLLDVVAARAVKPVTPWNPTGAELVWMRNAGDGTFEATQVITEGPGVGFVPADVNGDGKLEFVATEFFLHQQLSVFSCTAATWAACAAQPDSIIESVVDTGDGPFFQAEWVDLNGDGRKDILGTAQLETVDGTVVPGKVLAFECPQDWTPGAGAANWTRHVLADGYLPQPKQPSGSGAPGAPRAFVMDAKKGGKPHMVFSSDDGGTVELLTPASQDKADWSYTTETVYKSAVETSQGVRTIGHVFVADVDGSGRPELFIPSYAEGKLLMYTFDQAAAIDV